MTPTLVPRPDPSPTPFQPSQAQRRLLDCFHERPSFLTIHELCETANVGRATYYRWCQDPEFRLWFSASWSARLMMDGAVHLNIARVMCTRSFPYWKALFELTFDPKGLNALQQWQQNLARLDPSAFLAEPEPEPDGSSPEPDPESAFTASAPAAAGMLPKNWSRNNETLWATLKESPNAKESIQQ